MYLRQNTTKNGKIDVIYWFVSLAQLQLQQDVLPRGECCDGKAPEEVVSGQYLLTNSEETYRNI